MDILGKKIRKPNYIKTLALLEQNNWPYEHSKHAWLGSKKYLLSIGEKLCRTFGPTKCKFLPVLIKSWPDDRQDRHFC